MFKTFNTENTFCTKKRIFYRQFVPLIFKRRCKACIKITVANITPETRRRPKMDTEDNVSENVSKREKKKYLEDTLL